MLQAKKTLLVKSAVFYPLSDISAVLSVNQKFNKLMSVHRIWWSGEAVKMPHQHACQVKLEDDQGKRHFATMFTSVILSIIENEEGNVSTKLLQSSQTVFTIDN